MANSQYKRQRLTAFLGAIALALATQSTRASGACSLATVMSPLAGASGAPSLSGDGRFTAFTKNVAGISQVLLYDRLTCTTQTVSVNSSEDLANDDSWDPSISDDGRWVAFESGATNLDILDSNGVRDVFVRDRQTGTTFNIARPPGGRWANGPNFNPEFSGDGQFVAFVADASDLVAGDTNGLNDVFVRDIPAGTITRVSVATGGIQGTGPSTLDKPAISGNGRYVAFTSAMTNLVPGDTNAKSDIFRHDRQTGGTIRVSVDSNGGQAAGLSIGPAISSDGRFVAFTSSAALVPGDTNGLTDVFVRDVTLAVTTRVSIRSDGFEANSASGNASISGDGRYVTFDTAASNLVPGDTNGAYDVFVHDRQTNLTRRVSTSSDGAEGTLLSGGSSLSANGLFVAFISGADNLVPGDVNGQQDAFVTNWPLVSAPPNVNLLLNGTFSFGLLGWGTFALPDPGDIVWQTPGGVLEFWRDIGSTQAVVLQGTGGQLPAFSPITAQFDLGNSSGGRKRISVLIHDRDFSDLSVCTIWLDPGASMRTYVMRTHTTKRWSSATISFYAATADGAAAYRVDNVSLVLNPAASDVGTDCVDSTAPPPAGGGVSGNLLTNETFTGGLAPWGTFGQIVWQIASGVFEFYRPPGTPAGVVLQSTGVAMPNDQNMVARFYLGNSSGVRKRVTVLLHDGDFSDLSACTFWLPPGTPLSQFGMHSFATEAWTNATLSIYAATIGSDPWIQLDNVALLRTQITATVGTECLEPDFSMLAPQSAASTSFLSVAPARTQTRPTSRAAADNWRPSRGFTASRNAADGDAVGWHVVAAHGAPMSTLERSLDLRAATRAHLSFRSRRSGGRATAEVHVSPDGVSWQSVAEVPATEDWAPVSVDLSAFAGQLVHVRFVLRTTADGASPTWTIADLRVETAAQTPY